MNKLYQGPNKKKAELKGAEICKKTKDSSIVRGKVECRLQTLLVYSLEKQNLGKVCGRFGD